MSVKRWRLTKNTPCLVELSPSDDGTESSVADVGRGWREANRPDVVGETDGFFHPQDGYVIYKSSIDVTRVDKNGEENPKL